MGGGGSQTNIRQRNRVQNAIERATGRRVSSPDVGYVQRQLNQGATMRTAIRRLRRVNARRLTPRAL